MDFRHRSSAKRSVCHHVGGGGETYTRGLQITYKNLFNFIRLHNLVTFFGFI